MNGSPPRVRVKLIFFPLRGVFFGITPACAGKTKEDVADLINPQDHPRVCG